MQSSRKVSVGSAPPRRSEKFSTRRKVTFNLKTKFEDLNEEMRGIFLRHEGKKKRKGRNARARDRNSR